MKKVNDTNMICAVKLNIIRPLPEASQEPRLWTWGVSVLAGTTQTIIISLAAVAKRREGLDCP